MHSMIVTSQTCEACNRYESVDAQRRWEPHMYGRPRELVMKVYIQKHVIRFLLPFRLATPLPVLIGKLAGV